MSLAPSSTSATSASPTLPWRRSRFRLAFGLGLFLVVLWTITRLALTWAAAREAPQAASTLARVFAAGALLDLWVALWSILPLSLIHI